jgi:hypothetical protein
MTSKELRQGQIEQVQRAVRWSLGYFSRLTTRMDRAGLAPNDRLRILANEAYNAVHSLSIELH